MHGSYTDDGGMTISWTLKPPASGRGEESAQNR
jgi:hypothetical protein